MAIVVQSSGSCANQLAALEKLLRTCGSLPFEEFLAEVSISPVGIPELCELLVPNFTAAAPDDRADMCEVQCH